MSDQENFKCPVLSDVNEETVDSLKSNKARMLIEYAMSIGIDSCIIAVEDKGDMNGIMFADDPEKLPKLLGMMAKIMEDKGLIKSEFFQ